RVANSERWIGRRHFHNLDDPSQAGISFRGQQASGGNVGGDIRGAVGAARQRGGSTVQRVDFPTEHCWGYTLFCFDASNAQEPYWIVKVTPQGAGPDGRPVEPRAFRRRFNSMEDYHQWLAGMAVGTSEPVAPDMQGTRPSRYYGTSQANATQA